MYGVLANHMGRGQLPGLKLVFAPSQLCDLPPSAPSLRPQFPNLQDGDNDLCEDGWEDSQSQPFVNAQNWSRHTEELQKHV